MLREIFAAPTASLAVATWSLAAVTAATFGAAFFTARAAARAFEQATLHDQLADVIAPRRPDIWTILRARIQSVQWQKLVRLRPLTVIAFALVAVAAPLLYPAYLTVVQGYSRPSLTPFFATAAPGITVEVRTIVTSTRPIRDSDSFWIDTIVRTIKTNGRPCRVHLNDVDASVAAPAFDVVSLPPQAYQSVQCGARRIFALAPKHGGREVAILSIAYRGSGRDGATFLVPIRYEIEHGISLDNWIAVAALVVPPLLGGFIGFATQRAPFANREVPDRSKSAGGLGMDVEAAR